MRTRLIIALLMVTALSFAEFVKFETVRDISEIEMTNIVRNAGISIKTVSLALDEKVDLTEGTATIRGFDTYSDPTNPLLPQYNYKVTLDGHYDVSDVVVTNGDVQYSSKSGDIIPAAKRLLWSVRPISERTRSEAYNVSEYFPGKWLSFNAGFDGKQTHVYVHLYPVQWNPVTQEMVLLSNLTLDVLGTQKSTSYKSSMRSRTDARHIIITPSEWIATADSIAEYNTSLGVTSEAVTLSEIESLTTAENPNYDGYATHTNNNIQNYDFDTAKKLVTYFRDNNAHPNLEMITILGDAAIVPPSYYFYFEDAEEEMGAFDSWIPSDFLYASPDYDYTANFGISRISVDNQLEAQAYKQKMINWVNSWSSEWTNKASVAGGVAFNTPMVMGELISNHVIRRNILAGYEIEKYFRTKGNFTRSSFENHMQNDDFLWHLHICHGSGNGIWFDDETGITASQMMNYDQKSRLPIFLSVACMNGAYDTDLYQGEWSNESFAEGLIKSPGSGIAYIGGSRSNGGDAEFSFENGNLNYGGQNDTYALLYHYMKAYREIENPTFGLLVKSAYDNFLAEEDMNDEYNVAAYVRFIAHANAGLTLPEAPEQNNQHTVPQITLEDASSSDQMAQIIELGSNQNPNFTIGDDQSYSMEATQLFTMNHQGEEMLTNLAPLDNQNDVSEQFSLNIVDEEIFVLSKIIDSEFKEAWHYSRITKEMTGNENEINTPISNLRNYPNPFNPTTTISFSIAKSEDVKLTVYNTKGQVVKTLINMKMNSGKHSIQWSGKDNSNNAVSSGVYFYRLETGSKTETKKCIMMK
jgi:hypothetical protein